VIAAIAGVMVMVVAAGALGWVLAPPTARDRILERILREQAQVAAAPSDLFIRPDLGAVIVQVDPTAPGSAISPFIYGVASADRASLKALGATVNRWGGNPSTRYNWVNGHAWNAARDWNFANVNYSDSTSSQSDLFVQEALASGVAPLMTVPSIGWVARDDDQSHRSTGVPAQGGPALPGGSGAIAGYDPAANRALTSVPSLPMEPGPLVVDPNPSSPVVYQDEWVNHLMTHFGPTAVRYFAIDNEPDLWSSTHADVHPAEQGYNDMLANFEAYASAVKARDPHALVLGPTVSGWTGYFYSALDRGTDNFTTHADRTAHGGTAFLPWWLAQVAKSDRAHGTRTLDLLDVHYYPQGPNITSKIADPQTQALRIRSTRSLYDPDYTDESWISEPVALIPRLKEWIRANYPGTGLAISEYNWGGADDPSGSVAQALVLGIMGREGVDLANYWTYPDPKSFPGAAFRLYRNYDGEGGHFGDRSLPAASNHRLVTAFAARDSANGDLDLILVNGADRPANVRVQLGRAVAGEVRAYTVADVPDTIPHMIADLSTPVALPAMSATLVHILAGQIR